MALWMIASVFAGAPRTGLVGAADSPRNRTKSTLHALKRPLVGDASSACFFLFVFFFLLFFLQKLASSLSILFFKAFPSRLSKVPLATFSYINSPYTSQLISILAKKKRILSAQQQQNSFQKEPHFDDPYIGSIYNNNYKMRVIKVYINILLFA